MNFLYIWGNVESSMEQISKRWARKVYWGLISRVLGCYGREFGFHATAAWSHLRLDEEIGRAFQISLADGNVEDESQTRVHRALNLWNYRNWMKEVVLRGILDLVERNSQAYMWRRMRKREISTIIAGFVMWLTRRPVMLF